MVRFQDQSLKLASKPTMLNLWVRVPCAPFTVFQGRDLWPSK